MAINVSDIIKCIE